jgi:hypothetical protein
MGFPPMVSVVTEVGEENVMAREKVKRKAPQSDSGAKEDVRYCSVKPSSPVQLSPDVGFARASAIMPLANKWSNGTLLHYYFYTDRARDGETVTLEDGTTEWRTYVGAEPQRQIVRDAFAKWKALGIGLNFKETTDRSEAEVRIGFMAGDGSWSYVGTDILHQGADDRTMNFGWDLRRDPDTALHEIGHTLGLSHEHQNPNSGIEWNEEAVYSDLAAPPNKWKREKTHYNIIRKLDPDSVQGSSWDPNSIMHYPFKAGLILRPQPYNAGLTPAGGLSPRDVTWIKTFYPEIQTRSLRSLEPARSFPLNVGNGEQANFIFEPTATRKYKVQTFGACDTQIVLFEEVAGDWRYLAGDDDSGEDRNALVQARLRQGKRYAARVRLKHASGGAPPSVMLW